MLVNDAVIAGYLLWRAIHNRTIQWVASTDDLPRVLAEHWRRP